MTEKGLRTPIGGRPWLGFKPQSLAWKAVLLPLHYPATKNPS